MFLKAGDKVKVTIMFRGREQSRPELGFRLLQRLAEDVTELGFVESQPKQDGRNMIMVIGPHKKKAEAKAEKAAAKAQRGDEELSERKSDPQLGLALQATQPARQRNTPQPGRAPQPGPGCRHGRIEGETARCRR
ncbi:translation initiation factor IF-3 [Nonomuraea dietziae]|uniref:translation initiation factor IF-3 n=1 Tax=Nonomuraea dietziae TaxID=65515 RepID=UPI0031D31B21